jgi:hypothetical protein
MPDDQLTLAHPLANFMPLDEFIAHYAQRKRPYTLQGKLHLVRRLNLPVVKIGCVPHIDLVALAAQVRDGPLWAIRKVRSDKGKRHNWKRRRVRLNDD